MRMRAGKRGGEGGGLQAEPCLWPCCLLPPQRSPGRARRCCPPPHRTTPHLTHISPHPPRLAARRLWKGVVPLWGRQIPYTMMKFAAFENVVMGLYKYVVPKPKAECSKGEQLGVSFAAGYIAGILCAVVSHPADNLVSKLNATKGVSAGAQGAERRGAKRCLGQADGL